MATKQKCILTNSLLYHMRFLQHPKWHPFRAMFHKRQQLKEYDTRTIANIDFRAFTIIIKTISMYQKDYKVHIKYKTHGICFDSSHHSKYPVHS